jgi:molybdopterin molybdotransferase
MLTVAEALQKISENVSPLAETTAPLADALSLVLAREVLSDLDSPPFDKALMDGYAVVSSDFSEPTDAPRELVVVEEVTAGRLAEKRVESGQATRIMTGAPLPDGVDAVVRIEETELLDNGRVRILSTSVSAEQDLIRRGTNKRAGDRVLAAGRLLRAQEISALAEMGAAQVVVRPRPRIAVLATGDELVDVDQAPGPGQIRNSNEQMLVAQIRQAGGEPVPLGIARDNRDDLRRAIQEGLKCDMLLLSGGVSAGKLDLVPSELEHAGVEQVFHKVQVKPGKPIWFGVRDGSKSGSKDAASGGSTCRVFGLPGNPVSSMVCFELFVRTAIRRLTGISPEFPPEINAFLEHPFTHRGDRETYFPAAIDFASSTSGGNGPVARLMNWHGSSDLQSTVDANGMVLFPAEAREYAAGDLVRVVLW